MQSVSVPVQPPKPIHQASGLSLPALQKDVEKNQGAQGIQRLYVQEQRLPVLPGQPSTDDEEGAPTFQTGPSSLQGAVFISGVLV